MSNQSVEAARSIAEQIFSVPIKSSPEVDEFALLAADPHNPEFYELAKKRAERYVANERSQGTYDSEILKRALKIVMPLPLKEDDFVDRPMVEFLACVEDELVRRGVSLLRYDIRNESYSPRVQFPDAYHSYLEERKRNFASSIPSSNGSDHREGY